MSKSDSTRYGDSLAFLLSQLGAQSAAMFAQQIAPTGVTPRQFALLSHLAVGGPKSQQQLADLLGIHRNNMVDLVDAMEGADLVERVRDQVDRRAFEIHPTAEGMAAVAQINALVPALDAEIAGQLSVKQRHALIDTLRGLADHLGLDAAVHPSVAGRQRSKP
ncbi:DNA-binding MarR family transcriptional regulator [Branchiibius hedensis]|uniref:DNA-binding transcriptional regulator, MarR family n=1 Tax=Branchiibius hedensis TaxID=672460 RepID=A0A2Y8ZQL9_9MICO|nr:MarR family winged helix-turn-helix transcriptional regulator [Branchiibius hedensis]PWJ24870.1 DNA-binding MarR family transcriptional regulator [Branchiibius hedensis]SSA33686.1 DNA-binding transcriptional regulator, MarR family [Branchiibius hedensis]